MPSMRRPCSSALTSLPRELGLALEPSNTWGFRGRLERVEAVFSIVFLTFSIVFFIF